MIVQKKFGVVFTTISALIAGIFLFDQIAWAGDLINTVLEQQYQEQSQTFAPTYLQNQQSAAETLITQKQSIEDALSAQDIVNNPIATTPEESLDLQGPATGSDDGGGMVVYTMEGGGGDPAAGSTLSVTTQAGDIINYIAGAIDSIEKNDGSILRNIVVDESNNLLGVEITYLDGSIQNVANGKVLNVIKPDGTILNYDEQELLSSISYSDGSIANCSYVIDAQNNIIETILTDSSKAVHYDNNSRLLRVELNTGKTIDYDSGIISQITESDGSIFVFNIETNADNTITSTLSQYIDANSVAYVYTQGGSNSQEVLAAVEQLGIVSVLYDSGRKIDQVTTFDGMTQDYTDGLINSISGGFGSILYSYDINGDSIKKFAIDYGGIKNIYDEYGNIAKISADGIELSINNGVVSSIKKDDGTLIEDALFDANNNIVSAKITRPDGLQAIYTEGALSEVRQPDGSVFYYDNSGNITTFVDPAGITYLYSSIEEGGVNFKVADAQDPDSITDPEAIIHQKYDSQMRLIEAVRKDGVTLAYSYVFDSEGNISSTVISDGATITTYDANNNIERAEVLPTVEDPVSTISEYEYGRIRRVYKGNDLIYRYTYEFDDRGAEITVIEDTANNEFKRYKDQLLISVTDKDKLITSYEYDTCGRISKSTVMNLGKVINLYTYTYNTDSTTIEDIDGTIRIYDKDDKLKFLEEGGKTYAYTYTQDDAGQEISIQELIKIKDVSGTTANYDKGVLVSIDRPDGAVLSDFVISGSEVLSYNLAKDGIDYLIENDILKKETRPDGTVIEYYDSGWTKKIITPEGDVSTYYYEALMVKQLDMEGDSIDTAILSTISEDILQLASYPDPSNSLLLHLDGSNGATSSADNSAYNHQVTFNGSAHLDTSNMKFGSSSLALDSSGSYVTLPDSDDWNFASGNFTVDFWVRFNSTGGYQTLWSQGTDGSNYANLTWTGSSWKFALCQYNSVQVSIETADTISANTWYHIALVRSGSNWKIYRDGMAKGSIASAYAYQNWTGQFTIGELNYGTGHLGWYLNGNIDEFRVNKGNALWESPFLPAQEQVPDLYKTSGTFTSEVIELNATELDKISWDESRPQGTSISIQTRTGNTLNADDGTWSDWSSGLSNAAGSKLTSPAAKYLQYKITMTSDNTANTPQIFLSETEAITISYMQNLSGNDELSYVAITKDSLKYRYNKDGFLAEIVASNGRVVKYLYDESQPDVITGAEVLDNGIKCIYDTSNKLTQVIDSEGAVFNYTYNEAQGTVESSNEIMSGFYGGVTDFTQQDLSVTANNVLELGSYPDPSNSLLLHMNGNNGEPFTSDNSPYAHPLMFNGNAHLDTSNTKFGSSSLALAGNGDYITTPDSGDWNFGNGNFTIDFWVRFNSTSAYQTLFSQGTAGNSYWQFSWYGSSWKFNIYNSNSLLATSNAPDSLSVNTWYHVALVRNGNVWSIYRDGVLKGRITSSITIPNYTGAFTIGELNSGVSTSGWYLKGSIDEFRVSKGIARWTTGFTVPQAEYRDLYKTCGLLISKPVEITATALGYISANIVLPAGTTANVQTRTGASADINDGTWSQWLDATKDATGYKINSTANKYVQYQVILETTNNTVTPSVYPGSDYAIAMDYSYTRSFDTTAPPDDLVFKDYLIFTPPVTYSAPNMADLKAVFIPSDQTTPDIESRLLPVDSVIQTKSFKEGQDDITIEITKDNKLIYYVDGKIQAVYQKYSDNHLELLTQYTYDPDGNLVSVDLPSARNSLDTQILTARQQIAGERATYLRTLSEQYGLAYTQIRDQVQSIRDQINTQRAQLQPLLYQEVTRSRWVGWWIFGWYETYTETVEVPEVRAVLNQLNEQERQLNNEEANSYAQLSAQVESAKQTLIQDEETALAEVANQEAEFQQQIIIEESTPVILEYYRSILGRDPDEAETQAWISTVSYGSKIDVSTLKNALINSQERVQQEAFVEALKNSISGALYNYVALDDVGKGSFLGMLGLVSADAIKLGLEDIGVILSKLDTQNIHFGRSAFVSLGTILSNNNITYNLEDLALKTILVDILTGSFDRFSEGKLLELSMHALSKTASTYGVELNNTRLNYDELTQAFNSSGQVIAHLKNNHYVVVTNIAIDGQISYKEQNRGQNGYTWTVSKEDFQNSWTGYAIVQEASPQGVALPESVLAKKISDDTAMRIKGSCLPFLGFLIGAIFGAITGAATAVVGAISAIVTGISAVLAPIITGIGQLITGVAGFMTHIGSALFSAVQFVGTSLLPTIGGWIGGVGSWISGMGGWLGSLGGIISPTGFSLSGLGFALGKTVVVTALSIGISKGLEALGVNSTISGLLSSFVTGGVSGILNNGFSALSFITGGIQGLAIQGVNQLGARLGIDPMLSNVIGISAGAVIGAVGNNILPTGQFNLEGFSASLGKQIMPNVSSEMAYYGITKAGELLGVDPRISYLASCGLRSYISSGLSNEWKPEVMWESVKNGLVRGITSVSLEWGAQAIGLSPLVGSLTSAAIAGGIEALLMGQNPVQGIFDTYFRAGTGMLTLGGDGGNNPWLRAAYLSQVLDFSRIVQERGIVNALETYAAGFLHQQTINEIWKQGGIADLLNKPNQIEITTNAKGESVKRIYTMTINSDADKLISNYIDLSPTYDMLMGFREGNVITHCEFVIGPDGRPQLKNGEREVLNTDGSKRIETVENFNLTRMDYVDVSGSKTGYYVPDVGSNSIIVGADGKVTSGKFVSLVTDYSVSTKDNQVTDFSLKRDYVFSETQRANLLNSGVTEQDLYGFKEVVSFANGMLQYFVIPPNTPLFNIDQGAGKVWLDSIEADGRAFWEGAYSLFRDAVAGDPLPQFSSDSAYPYANIELNLVLPGRSEGIIAGLDLLNVVTGDITSPLNSFVTQNSTWNHNTDYSAQLYAASFDMGYRFVFGGGAKFLLSGEGSNRLDWGNLNTLYSSLNTTNTIGIGFSADTVSLAKSWLVPDATRADHYFLFSPQLSPKELEEYMRRGGISPDMVTVVETSGDFPRQWLGGFSNNTDSNRVKKWDYIKIISGPGVSLLNPFSSHGVPVRGVLDGGQYIVEVNGVRSAGPVSLSDIYSYYANRSSSN